jgi:hypothetical protein
MVHPPKKRKLSKKSHNILPNRMHLLNTDGASSPTLLSFIEHATIASLEQKARRHLYILTCYFDLAALTKIVSTVCNAARKVNGVVAGITIAVDVGEWIRCRLSLSELRKQLVGSTRMPSTQVDIVSVQFANRLLHAKSYGLIEPGTARKGFSLRPRTQPSAG